MSAGNYGFVFIVAQSELITSDSTRYEPEHMIDQQHTLHADNTDVTVTRVNYRTSTCNYTSAMGAEYTCRKVPMFTQ